MTIIIESTKGRYVYAGAKARKDAGDDVLQWIAKCLSGGTCATITITVHQDDENCDHEHPEETSS